MHGLSDFIMPYMIQWLREYSGKVDLLMKERKEAQQAAVQDEASKKEQQAQSNAYLSLMPLALPAPPQAGGLPDAVAGGGFGGVPAGGFGAMPAFGQSVPQYGGGQF